MVVIIINKSSTGSLGPTTSLCAKDKPFWRFLFFSVCVCVGSILLGYIYDIFWLIPSIKGFSKLRDRTRNVLGLCAGSWLLTSSKTLDIRSANNPMMAANNLRGLFNREEVSKVSQHTHELEFERGWWSSTNTETAISVISLSLSE